MKKSRKKVWIFVIATLLAFGLVGGYFGGKYVLRLRVEGWRREGIAASKAGDHARAADLLVRVLQRRGAFDVEVMDSYIRSREAAELPNGQHLAETIAAIRLLLRQHPERIDQQLHLLELYDRLDRRPEAVDTANALLKQHPNDVRVLILKTKVLMRMEQYREALQTAEQWAAVAPEDFQAHLNRLRARKELADQLHAPKDDLIDDAQKLMKAHPGDPRFELLVGFAYAQSDDVAKGAQAAKWFTTAAAHPHLKDDVAQELITQFDAAGMCDNSLAVLQQLVKDGAGPAIRKVLGQRQWQLGNWQESAAALSYVTAQDVQTDVTLVALKAMALAFAKDKAGSDQCRAAISSQKQAAARAWTLILSPVLDLGKPDDRQIVSECRSALAVDPSNVYLQYYYGDANDRLRESDLAIQAWRFVVQAEPAWVTPGSRLVEALLQKGNSEQALWFATTIARRNPTQAAAVITLARAWSAGIDSGSAATVPVDQLLNFSDEVQKAAPREEQTLLLRVQLLGQKGDKVQATRALRDMLSSTPAPREQVLLALVTLSRRYDLKCETEVLERCEKVHGVTPNLALTSALNRFAAGDAGAGSAGLRHFDDLLKRRAAGPDLPWQMARARYLEVSGNPDARAAWIALGDAYPKELDVQKAAVQSRATLADWDFQTRTIERLKALAEPGGLVWQLAQARLYVEGGHDAREYEQGALLLNKILNDHRSLCEAHVLLGRALVHLNRVDGAIQHFGVAAKLDPTSVPIALELASVLQSRGDFERVNHELDRIAPQLRSSAERRQAALMLAKQGKSDEAVKLLKAPTSGTSGDADEQNNLMLAVLYRQRQQFDKAEEVVRKLLEHPDLTTVQFAASLFSSQGQRADAEKALAKLDTLKIDPGLKELTWGIYYAQIGEAEHATEQFKSAAQKAPANPVSWRLLALAYLAAGKPNESIATIEDGTRAVLNPNATNPKGEPNEEFAALKEHGEIFAYAAKDPTLRTVAVRILQDPTSSETSFELLQIIREGRRSTNNEQLASQIAQLVERHPESLPCQIQLIEAYMSMGRPADALGVADKAMNTFSTTSETARITVRVAGAAGRWKEVQTAAELWKRRTPSEAMLADQAIAAAEIHMQQYDAALIQLKPYLAAAKTSPDGYPDLLTLYCIALADSGGEREATEILWPQVQRTARYRVYWVTTALRSIDPKLGVRWLDQLAGVLPADATADRTMLAQAYEEMATNAKQSKLSDTATVLYGGIDASELSAKAMALHEGIAAQPNATSFSLMAAAYQAEIQKNTAAAESLYHRALKVEPNNLVAQNNLAMLLANTGGDLDEAEKLATDAVNAQPRRAVLRDTLAFVQAKSRRFALAAQTEQVAIQLEPDNLIWHVRYSQFLLDGGDVVGASKAVNAIEQARLDTQKATLEKGEQEKHDDALKQLAAIRAQVRGSKSL